MEDIDFSDFVEASVEIPDFDFGPSKKPGAFIVFDVLLLVGIVWSVIEFFSIISLFSTTFFLCLFLFSGLLLARLIVHKLQLVYLITKWDILLVLVSVSLAFVVMASFLNRTIIVNSVKYESSLVVKQPYDSFKSFTITIVVDGAEKEVEIPIWYGLTVNKGDKLNLQINTGLFGFLSEVK